MLLPTLGSSSPKPYCCLPAGRRSQGRDGCPHARTARPTAGEQGARGCGSTHTSHAVPRGCARPHSSLPGSSRARQTPIRVWPNTDMIQEKGFQTIKCNRQRDRPHESAAAAQPASAPRLRSSLCWRQLPKPGRMRRTLAAHGRAAACPCRGTLRHVPRSPEAIRQLLAEEAPAWRSRPAQHGRPSASRPRPRC